MVIFHRYISLPEGMNQIRCHVQELDFFGIYAPGFAPGFGVYSLLSGQIVSVIRDMWTHIYVSIVFGEY